MLCLLTFLDFIIFAPNHYQVISNGLLVEETNVNKEIKKTHWRQSVQKIEDGIKKPNNIFWIAFVNRLPVGYAKLKLYSNSEFIESKDVCQLQKIYVLKDFQSMKIGFELQDLLLKKAKELNFNKVWLSVLNSNERAINFYKKNGFEKIGNHDFQIGKENFEFIAMKKKL